MLKRALRTVKELLYPDGYTCELCGVETFGRWICAECDDEMPYNKGITCPVCGRRNQRNQLCFDCVKKIPSFERGVSAFVYEGPVIRLIKAYKKEKQYLKNFFAPLMLEKIRELPPYDAVVYVPMTKARLKERGYNQSKILAEVISEAVQKPVLDVIEKTADTPEQKELSAEERAENLKTCFKISDRKACKGKTFLLVDDVLTTGATAEAVCEKLKKAGALKVFLATVASVEYKPRPAAAGEKQ